ncbi:ead/Ea22-like family protein [Escherichia coli]|nr:ead/Ea22-like family protein [Escherichia coli]
MSKIDHQALREAAVKATWGDWDSYKPHRGARGYEVRLSSQAIAQHVLKNNAEFIAAFNPKVALALLDERERNRQYIKRRDQENEDIALTVGKLRVEREAAKKRIAELEAELVSQTYKLNELSGNSPVTPDGWISCSEQMPVIGELNWRTSFPLLITCEIGVIPAYYGFVSVNGDRHYGFMESLKYGDDSGGHPQTNEYGLISNVTHWMPLPEPPSRMVNNAAS